MNIHVIIGEDDFLVGEAAKKVVGDGVGLEVVDSTNASNAELQLADLHRAEESVLTPPFLEPKKVTWWKNVGFLPGSKCSEEVKLALERFAETLTKLSLSDNQHFILSGKSLLKTSIFAKRLAGVAELVVFPSLKPWEVARDAQSRAIEFAAEEGLSFQPGVEAKFVSIVGTDARSLKSEVAKLRDYLGNDSKVITAEAVAAVTSPGAKVEAEVWDVTDAIGDRKKAAALEAIRKFELENGFAVFMSGMIERFFRQLLDVKEGRTEGMAPFTVKKMTGFAAKWNLRELKAARARFLDLREKVVSGMTSGDVLVVTTLLKVI